MARSIIQSPVIREDVNFSDLAPSDKKFEFRATQNTPDAVLQIRKGAALLGTDMAVFARDAVAAAYERVQAGLPIKAGKITNADLEGGPLLDVRVACGPLEEARESSTKFFSISKAVADEIGFRKDSSFFARTRGESMEGAGIPNESIVCFLPLMMDKEPQDNRQIALVAFHDESNAVIGGTVKRWTRNEKGQLELRNGKGEVVPIPNGTDKVRAVAIVTGVVGGL